MSQSCAKTKLLGMGTYGCGFSPALECSDKKGREWTRKKTIGKIFFRAADAEKELEYANHARRLDPEQRFFLYPSDICSVSQSTYQRQGDKRCRVPKTDDLKQLLLTNGGKSLHDFLDKRRGKSLSRGEVLRLVQRLFTAVDVLSKGGVVHQDIKPQNVVLNNKDGIKIIDWGLSRTRDEMFDPERNVMFHDQDELLPFTYALSPPEYRILSFEPFLRRNAQFNMNVENLDDFNLIDTLWEVMEAYIEKHEKKPIECIMWVPRSLKGWWKKYGFDDETWMYEFCRLFQRARYHSGYFKKIPGSASDAYSLGFLLFCFSPWLVDEEQDNERVVYGYRQLVKGLMIPDPMKRLDMGKAIEMVDELIHVSMVPHKRYSDLTMSVTSTSQTKSKSSKTKASNNVSVKTNVSERRSTASKSKKQSAEVETQEKPDVLMRSIGSTKESIIPKGKYVLRIKRPPIVQASTLSAASASGSVQQPKKKKAKL